MALQAQPPGTLTDMWTAVVTLLAVWLVLIVSRQTLGGWGHGFFVSSVVLGLYQILAGKKVDG